MMPKLATYDPKKVNVIFGPVVLTGFADGTFVKVETDGDGISALVGCDQEIVRSIDPGSILKKITVTLLQSSDSNDELSIIHNADNQTGAGVMPMSVQDLSGRSLLMADQAWITKKPALNRGKTASDGNCEWVFYAVVPDEAFLVGGHS